MPLPPSAQDASGNAMDPTIRDEFARHVHQYQRDYISHAETKAGVIATASVGALAFLEEKGALDLHAVRRAQIEDLFGASAALAFALASLFALWVVRPRLGVDRAAPAAASSSGEQSVTPRSPGKKGAIFWDEVRGYQTADSYASSVAGLTFVGVQRELSMHAYVLAGINQAKYRAVNRALWCLLAAVACLCANLLLRDSTNAATAAPHQTTTPLAPSVAPLPSPPPSDERQTGSAAAAPPTRMGDSPLAPAASRP